ncbi:MAG: hypothetical protein AAF456_13240 [Planctomycetota bacterium]
MSRRLEQLGISFGTASIDALVNPRKLLYRLKNDRSHVVCIAGPDGVGKSILALTAASVYASTEHSKNRQKVIYASTDLNFDQAKTTWDCFGLGEPRRRRKVLREELEALAFERERCSLIEGQEASLAKSCCLNWTSPFQAVENSDNLPNHLYSFDSIFDENPSGTDQPAVSFLDLAEFSAGDDWGLLNRTLGLLCDLKDSKATHLLVLDAVEGLEAMVGENDGFGLKRSRRSRLAQLVRAARNACCNIIFVIEQRELNVHLDEVFVSDLVIRLGTSEQSGYLQKTIEIEKARSVAHVRGVQEFQIRDGTGGRTNKSPKPKPDNPKMNFGAKPIGYLQALPSLHHRINDTENIELPHVENRWFPKSLEDLNRILDAGSNARRLAADPRDRILVSVGDPGTLKSRLSYAFLSEAFSEDGRGKRGGVILITTQPIDHGSLLQAIAEYGQDSRMGDADSQVMVREIKPRFLSSSGLLFRIRMCIRKMMRRLSLDKSEAHRIRLVIDDWNSILESHPAISEDPQVLQSVIRLLQREGVLTHIVSTQFGSPQLGNKEVQSNQRHDISKIEARRIHTWPVDFFGGRRVAVTSSISSSSDNPTSVFELRRSGMCTFKLEADDHFALYKDLEIGQAKRVDLKVKLYSGFHESDELPEKDIPDYTREVSSLFGGVFPNENKSDDVVQFESIERYGGFKEYVQNLDDSHLNETLVFAIDEFWIANDPSERSPFADLSDFMTSDSEFGGQRREAFEETLVPQLGDTTTRVPLHKDFGLMLADKSVWQKAKDLALEPWTLRKYSDSEFRRDTVRPYYGGGPKTSDLDIASLPTDSLDHAIFKERESKGRRLGGEHGEKLKVGHVWNALCHPEDRFENFGYGRILFMPSWPVFLTACSAVANSSGRQPYDIDLRTSETLSSNLIEIWISECHSRLVSGDLRTNGVGFENSCREALERLYDVGTPPSEQVSLSELCELFPQELFMAVQLLIRSLPSRFREPDLKLGKADPDAVAFRSWFAPGVLCQRENRNLTPLRLPGRHHVRGDWYLGAARGSRSKILAEKAISKLVSLPMNLKRAREGIGLPVLSFDHFEISTDKVMTLLTSPNKSGRGYRQMSLKEIGELERDSGLSAPSKMRRFCRFAAKPLFRSNIRHYENQANEFFLFAASLLRTLNITESYALLRPYTQELTEGYLKKGRAEFDLELCQFKDICGAFDRISS